MSRVLNFIFVFYSSSDGMIVYWTNDSHTTEQLLVNGTPTPSNAAVLNTPIAQDVRRQVVTSGNQSELRQLVRGDTVNRNIIFS
jgi:hypothetical protein